MGKLAIIKVINGNYFIHAEGITELSKQLGKKKFEELLSSYIVKPHGKPVLVPVTDKRPIYSTVEQDFD